MIDLISALGGALTAAPIALAIQSALHRERDQKAADVWATLAKGQRERWESHVAEQEKELRGARMTIVALHRQIGTEQREKRLLMATLEDAERELIPLREIAETTNVAVLFKGGDRAEA